MLKIIINGANGKMGQVSSHFLAQQSDIKIVGALTRNDDLAHAIQKTQANIVIDFTAPDAVFDNTKKIINIGAHPIIGTTGLKDEQIKELKQLCANKKLGGIIAPNFSLGAILMMRFAKEASHHLKHAEIIEMHHQHKKDAPSGTALKTASLMNQKGVTGANTHDIPIHSVRLPGILAQQSVIFGEQGETFHIEHRAIDRSCYMPGLLLACRTVTQLTELIYGLENIL